MKGKTKMRTWVAVLIATGLIGGGELVAQKGEADGDESINKAAPVRGMDKEEYAGMAKARWERLQKEFTERKRTKDPFGGAIDPALVKEEPVAIATVLDDKKEVATVKVVSLQDAVDKFQVNGVNAAKQMVMVGFRSLRRGDPVEIEHEGESFKLRIVKITVNEVVFMNTKNQETASVRLGVRKIIMGPGEGKGKLKENVVKPGSTFKVK